jgi:hypothetical protein
MPLNPPPLPNLPSFISYCTRFCFTTSLAIVFSSTKSEAAHKCMGLMSDIIDIFAAISNSGSYWGAA